MYEKKDIILDGEMLGNNVVINRCFELIYNISPLIIKNFISIVNNTPFVLKPVRIKKYDFTQNNCINIHFKNKYSSGNIELAYILNKNNELLLDTYSLTITEGENKGFSTTKQNSKSKLMPKETVQVQYNIYQSNEIYVEIPANNEKSKEPTETEQKQVLYENKKQPEKKIVEEDFFNIEKILNNAFESNEDIEELDEIIEIPEEKTLEDNINIQDDKEKNAKIKTEVSNETNNNENHKNIGNIENVIIEQDFEEENINTKKELINNKNIEDKNSIKIENVDNSTKKISNDEFLIQDTLESIIKEDAIVSNNTFLEDVQIISTSNIEKLNNFNEAELDTNDNKNNTNEIENIKNIDLPEDVKEEKFDNICVKDKFFEYEKLNSYDFIDFYETIPKFSNNYLEKDEYDCFSEEICSNDTSNENNVVMEENVSDNSYEKSNTNLRKFGTNINLNRAEKIALYQEILTGYDNQMTETKLNLFKDKIKSMQKYDNLTKEDVLNAQVELLVDTSSKAFRILDSNLKEDVIQIDDELFLSKDKIYTWGDVYILDW